MMERIEEEGKGKVPRKHQLWVAKSSHKTDTDGSCQDNEMNSVDGKKGKSHQRNPRRKLALGNRTDEKR